MHFRNNCGHLLGPFHVTCGDSSNIFFSKIRGWLGWRAYDSHQLLSCANTVNHLSAIEYGGNGLQFGSCYNKQENKSWAKLHPLIEGGIVANVGDYSLVSNDDMVIDALK